MIGLRLKSLRENKGFTQKELAELVQITPKAISFYELEQRDPSNDLLVKFAEIFEVSTDYLLGTQEISGTKIKPTEDEKTVTINVLGKIAAGTPIEAIEEIIDTEEIVLPAKESEEDYFGLRIDGDSMAPRILSGDVVICKKQPCVESNEIAVVLINGNDATLKRVKRNEIGITLIPDNATYPPKFYSNEEIESLPIIILGKVIELRGKF